VNLIDSSAWLEYFAGSALAGQLARPIEQIDKLLVPTIVLHEVAKRVMQQRGEDAALQVVAVMHQGTVVDLDATIALSAAQLSVASKLPLADSVILATARLHEATIWTLDADFKGLPGVRYFAREK
jgi:predicted nucleic acid-binding protein